MPQVLKHKPQVVFACALYLAIVGFYVAAAMWYPLAYIWATYEDLVGEWVQFWSIAIAFAVSVRLVFVRWRYRWFFLALSLSCFYVAMEEISWGQRLFGFSSPDFFRANNLQGETNLHNFFTGPFGTTLKATLSYGLAAGLAMYGLVFPLLSRLRFRLALWLDAKGVAAPPLYLWPYFATAAFLECSPFRINEAEVAEILVGLGLAMMAVHYQFTKQGVHESNPTTKGSRKDRSLASTSLPIGLTQRLLTLAAIVLALSVGTTTALYASPSGKNRIDRRIENGVEKFAGRYARYESWDISIQLYQRVLEKAPNRVSIMRKIAECIRNDGDPASAEQILHRALAVDLKKLSENPRRASVNRSIARTYRSLGDEENVQKHLRQALRIAKHRVEKYPNSASAAYSLGKTYSFVGRNGPALVELSRAFKIEPSSRKYRKAYYGAKKHVR